MSLAGFRVFVIVVARGVNHSVNDTISQEFCHRRGVFFQQNRGTIRLACSQAVALRGAPTTARRHVAAPRHPPPLHMAYDDHDRNFSHIHGFA